MAGVGRIAVLGSGAFAVPLLERLASVADELLVISQPDRRAGRGLRPRPTPVADLARERSLPVVTPPRIASPEARAVLRDFAPDGLLLAAYGQIVPPDLLAVAPLPPLNVHPSLLPRHRGASPVAGTIVAGDEASGVTVIVMVDQVDAGPIVSQRRLELHGRETAPELEAALGRLAAVIVPEVLVDWRNAVLLARPQDERRATYTQILRRSDGRIDWSTSATPIDRQVRALQPWPGAWTTFRGKPLHVRRAAPAPAQETHPTGRPELPGTLLPGRRPMVVCGDGLLELLEVQPSGRSAMPAADWLRGLRGAPAILGETAD